LNSDHINNYNYREIIIHPYDYDYWVFQLTFKNKIIYQCNIHEGMFTPIENDYVGISSDY